MREIETHGSAIVGELAQSLDVSEMTIRRDLLVLERQGLVRRIHGGAVNARGRNYEPPLFLRTKRNREAKRALGKYAAEMVAEGDTVSLDVGSTIYEVALSLVSRKNITVITPSLHIANLLLQQQDMRIIIPGGVLRPTEASMIGDLARNAIAGFFVDRLFLGVGGLEAEVGLTEFNLDDTLVKQALIKNAKEVVVVADSSKFQKIAFSLIGPFSVVHRLVTNEPPPDPLSNSLRRAGVVISVVTPPNGDGGDESPSASGDLSEVHSNPDADGVGPLDSAEEHLR